MKTVLNFILENWEIVFGIGAGIIEILLRTIPTSKNVSVIDNAWKFLNWIITNKRKRSGDELISGLNRNRIDVNINKHILFVLLFISSIGYAQNPIYTQSRAFFPYNGSDTVAIKNTRTSLQSATGNTGGLFFDKANNKWRVWNGTTWVNWNNFSGSVGTFWPLAGDALTTANVSIADNTGTHQLSLGAPNGFDTFQWSTVDIYSGTFSLWDGASQYHISNATFSGWQSGDIYFGADFVHTFSNVTNFIVTADLTAQIVTGTDFQVSANDEAIIFGNNSVAITSNGPVNVTAGLSTVVIAGGSNTTVTSSGGTVIGSEAATTVRGNGTDSQITLTSDIVLNPTFGSVTSTTKHFFNSSATLACINVGSVAADPSAAINFDVWGNSAGNTMRTRLGGTNLNFITGLNLTTNLIPIVNGTATITNDVDLSFTGGNTLNSPNAIFSTDLRATYLGSNGILYDNGTSIVNDNLNLFYTEATNGLTIQNQGSTHTSTYFGGEIQLQETSTSDRLTIRAPIASNISEIFTTATDNLRLQTTRIILAGSGLTTPILESPTDIFTLNRGGATSQTITTTDNDALNLLTENGTGAGAISLLNGSSSAGGGATMSLTAGATTFAGGLGGLLQITAGSSSAGNGGDLQLRSGTGTNDGDIYLMPRTNGEVIILITRTSCAGAPSGAIANVGGVLNICP